jgi:hypothetical protein
MTTLYELIEFLSLFSLFMDGGGGRGLQIYGGLKSEM